MISTSKDETMANPSLLLQLNNLRCLDTEALALLDRMLDEKKALEKSARLIMQGHSLKTVFVVRDGWAVRYKTLSDGRRQILNFLIPGDIMGYSALLFKTAEYSVEAITTLSVNTFTPEAAFQAFSKSSKLAVALGWLAGQSERQLDEQITRVGRRRSTERMAHLFMELHHRLRRSGKGDKESSTFPLTQTVLADALGLSHVHTNRSFRLLAGQGMARLCDGQISLMNISELANVAGFDADYLKQEPLPKDSSQALC